MSKASAAIAALFFLAPSLSPAEPASHAWLGATIHFDRAAWHIRAPGDGPDVLLTCIAADCPERPTLYGYAWRTKAGDTPCAATGRTEDDSRPIAMPATPLGFVAIESWSGCRALDSPIVEACATADGTAWRIVSHLVSTGCNFDPEIPHQRLVDLLLGIVPPPAGP